MIKAPLANATHRFVYEESPNPKWHFRIDLPYDVRATIIGKIGSMAPLAEFSAGERRFFRVQVTVEFLAREVNPLYWFGLHLDRIDAVLLGARPSKNAKGDDVDWTAVIGGRKCRGLSRILKDGGSIYHVEVLVPHDADEYSFLEARQVAQSFALLNPTNIPFAEPVRWRRSEGGSFAYPASWVADTLSDRITLTNECSAGCCGRIEISWQSGTVDIGRLLRDYVARLSAYEFRICGNPLFPVPSRENFKTAYVARLDGSLADNQVEVIAHIYQTRDKTIQVVLLNFARSTAAEWWVINRTAFSLVSQTLNIDD